jgi:DNA modification methylase
MTPDTVIHGDALAELRKMADNSVDAIVTDPPGNLSFMGKEWDTFGHRSNFIRFMTEVFAEAKRCLKPGGHALVWALPRTSHWTATALEDAGWEIRDCVYSIFGSGFPKSLNISKAIDKHLGKEREVIGEYERRSVHDGSHRISNGDTGDSQCSGRSTLVDITAPATPEAAQWEGWGSALKPSVECWWLCRKPLAESSIAAQVLATGTGGLNVDACRVKPTGEKLSGGNVSTGHGSTTPGWDRPWMHDDEVLARRKIEAAERVAQAEQQGRFPSHLLLSHSLWCVPRSCSPDCPIAELDRQSGVSKTRPAKAILNGGVSGSGIPASGVPFVGGIASVGYEDQGGASRYFQSFPPDDVAPFLYTSKASRRERNQGCEGLPEGESRRHGDTGPSENAKPNGQTALREGNNHPTVKPLALMRWLIRLITPPGGIVLDCFAGSGSTLVACVQEGKHFIGIEQSEEYIAICEARIAHAWQEQGVTQAQEFDCDASCPIRIIGEQSGERKVGGVTQKHKAGTGIVYGGRKKAEVDYGYGDTGTAARYFTQFPPDSLFAECSYEEEVAI